MSKEVSYRPDIDGLRAVGVLGVILCHARLGVSGGYVGVDVFFVISGYLITTIIARELRAGTFTLANYWLRRMTRLSPAALVVTFFTLACSVYLLQSDRLQDLGQAVVTLFLFHSNVFFYRNTGYFDADASSSPFLHTWSLSVEEQFYIFFPIASVFAFRYFQDRGLRWLISVVVAGSFTWSFFSLYGNNPDPKGAFYLLQSRAWEMALGGILTFIPVRPITRTLSFGSLSLLGVAAIIVPYFTYNEATSFPGPAALPPCLGTALLIWIFSPKENRRGWTHFALSNPASVFIGLISYPLYLWHWPLLVFAKSILAEHPSPTIATALLTASVILAYLTYRFVETPIRQKKFLALPSRRVVAVLGIALVLGASARLIRLRGIDTGFIPLPEQVQTMIKSIEKPDRVRSKPETDDLRAGQSLTPYGDVESDPRPTLLLWGDSHAGILSGIINEVVTSYGRAFYSVSVGGMMPLLDPEEPTNEEHLFAIEIIKQIDQLGVDHVILASRWSCHMNGHPTDTSIYPPIDPRPLNDLEKGYRRRFDHTMNELERRGLGITIIRQVPVQRVCPSELALFFVDPAKLNQEKAIRWEQHLGREFSAELIMNPASHPSIQFIVPSTVIFEGADYAPICSDEGEFYYCDQDHLSRSGADRLKPLLREAFHPYLARESGSDPPPLEEKRER